jgi:hypothetical protein
MEKQMFMELEGHDVEAFNAAARTIKCLQIANGAAYVDDQGNWKRSARREDPRAGGHRRGGGRRAGAGGLPLQERPGAADEGLPARPGELDADPATIKKGQGPVLVRPPGQRRPRRDGLQEHCNILVYFGHWWNLEERMQILERIGPPARCRPATSARCFVYNIIARGTVDEDVIERVESKREVQDILLEAMKRRAA